MEFLQGIYQREVFIVKSIDIFLSVAIDPTGIIVG